MKVILEAAPTITDYSVIINKARPSWFERLQRENMMDEWKATLMAGLPVTTSSFHFTMRDDTLDGVDNLDFQWPQEAKDFIWQAPGMELLEKDVKDVVADQIEELAAEMEAKQREMEADKTMMQEEIDRQRRAVQQAAERAEQAKLEMETAKLDIQRKMDEANAAHEAEMSRMKNDQAESQRKFDAAKEQIDKMEKQANATFAVFYNLDYTLHYDTGCKQKCFGIYTANHMCWARFIVDVDKNIIEHDPRIGDCHAEGAALLGYAIDKGWLRFPSSRVSKNAFFWEVEHEVHYKDNLDDVDAGILWERHNTGAKWIVKDGHTTKEQGRERWSYQLCHCKGLLSQKILKSKQPHPA